MDQRNRTSHLNAVTRHEHQNNNRGKLSTHKNGGNENYLREKEWRKTRDSFTSSQTTTRGEPYNCNLPAELCRVIWYSFFDPLAT